jgi:hypothetical protein
LVLTAYLKEELSKRNRNIQEILSENRAVLEKEIGDGVQQLDETIDKWDVQVLSTVILVCFGQTLKPGIKNAIANIHESLRGYARRALESLDIERFSHIDGDLVYNLRKLSFSLGDDIQSKFEELIDRHRKVERKNEPDCEHDFDVDLLKSHGLRLKSLEEVYKGISLADDFLFHLRLMNQI